MGFPILLHSPGDVWSPHLPSSRILLGWCSLNSPLLLIFPLTNFSIHQSSPPPHLTWLHSSLLYSQLSPKSFPYCKILLQWSLYLSRQPPWLKPALLFFKSIANNIFNKKHTAIVLSNIRRNPINHVYSGMVQQGHRQEGPRGWLNTIEAVWAISHSEPMARGAEHENPLGSGRKYYNLILYYFYWRKKRDLILIMFEMSLTLAFSFSAYISWSVLLNEDGDSREEVEFHKAKGWRTEILQLYLGFEFTEYTVAYRHMFQCNVLENGY